MEIIFDDDITCETLIANIKSTYSVEEMISKGYGWVTNLYLKINFPKSKFKQFKFDFIFMRTIYMKKIKFFIQTFHCF